jgi:hypothetical protein
VCLPCIKLKPPIGAAIKQAEPCLSFEEGKSTGIEKKKDNKN